MVMKQFFIGKILPPVLIQLSVIAALMYYEVKNFVPYASTGEVGVDFLPIFVLLPSVILTWVWQAVVSLRYLSQIPKPRSKVIVLLVGWLLVYPILLVAAILLAGNIFL